MIHITATIHAKAEVDRSSVSIGRLTRVWQFASVIRRASIGERCNIASCAIVDGARIGNGCLIGHGAFIDPGMVLGDDVFIGPHVTLCNDAWPVTGKDGWFRIEDLIAGAVIVTKIEGGASIGANAVLLPGITIGAHAMVAAGSVVSHNVPAMMLYRRDGTLVPIDALRMTRMRSVEA